jgi:hypothetical protein
LENEFSPTVVNLKNCGFQLNTKRLSQITQICTEKNIFESLPTPSILASR